MQLSELKKEMQFNAELLSLIGTLKNIASSKYHLLEREKERFEEFMQAFAEFFRVVNLVEIDDPLIRQVTDVVGIIIVTSDSGFMGGLNAGIIRKAFDEVQGDIPDSKVKLVVIGEKGASKVSDMNREFKFFPGIDHETRYQQSLELTDYIVGEVLGRQMGKVILVYPRPLSFSAQVVEAISILPCAELFDQEKKSEISEHLTGRKKFIADARKLVVESAFADMLEYLARTWVTAKLYEVFEDSKLAEFGARAMHLEGSHQTLADTQKILQHKFFKASHEKIDKGMRESYSAGNIRKKRKKADAKAARAAAAEENKQQ